MKKLIILSIIMLLCSCSKAITSKPYFDIKGNSKILLNVVDYDLKGKSAVSGYIYLKRSKTFAQKATVKIANKEFKTDANGYFTINTEPGEYTLLAEYENNNSEILQVKLVNDQHLIISFELGATGLNGRVY
jgi:uncharacterized membrane protein